MSGISKESVHLSDPIRGNVLMRKSKFISLWHQSNQKGYILAFGPNKIGYKKHGTLFKNDISNIEHKLEKEVTDHVHLF